MESSFEQVYFNNPNQGFNDVVNFQRELLPQQIINLAEKLPEDLLILQKAQAELNLSLSNPEVYNNPFYGPTIQQALKTVEQRIARIKEVQGIQSAEFDEKNYEIIKNFVDTGRSALVNDIDGKKYFIAHGNIDQNGAHIIEGPNGEKTPSLQYIYYMAAEGIIPRGSEIDFVSCYAGDINEELFKSFQKEIERYGVKINIPIQQEGEQVITVQESNNERLNNLKKGGQEVNFGSAAKVGV